jgi:DNA-binding transcriptional MerR regulator
MADISIGELARRSGVKVPTIRYYEQAGLLPIPGRTEGHQRRYGRAAVGRLNFIRHARELGFEVAAVRELLALSEQPYRPCAELSALRRELQHSLDACGHGRVGECRVIEALAERSAA